MSLCYFEHSFAAQNNISLFMPDFILRIEKNNVIAGAMA